MNLNLNNFSSVTQRSKNSALYITCINPLNTHAEQVAA